MIALVTFLNDLLNSVGWLPYGFFWAYFCYSHQTDNKGSTLDDFLLKFWFLAQTFRIT